MVGLQQTSQLQQVDHYAYLLTYSLLMVRLQQTSQLQQVDHYAYLLTYLFTFLLTCLLTDGGITAKIPAAASRPLCILIYLLMVRLQPTSQLQQADHYAYLFTY